MQPQQITVDTATLKAVLKRDVEMVTLKRDAYQKQASGLKLVLVSKNPTQTMSDLLSFPGVITYLRGLKEVAECEQALMERQLRVLRERLQRVESDIVIPGNVPGTIIT